MYSLTELLGQPQTNMVEKPVVQEYSKKNKPANHSIAPPDRREEFVSNTMMLEGGEEPHTMKGEDGYTRFGIRSVYYKPEVLGKPLDQISRDEAKTYYKEHLYPKEIDLIDSDAIAYRILDQKVQASSAYISRVKDALRKVGIEPPNTKKLKDLVPLINSVEPKKMYNALNDTVLENYKKLKNWETYKNGWTKDRVKYNPYVIENERTKQAMKNKVIREQVKKAFDPNNMSFTDMLFKDTPSSTMVKIR